MKVGLNATCINDRPSGAKHRFIGIYRELVKRLPNVEFVVYEPADCRVASWFNGAPNVSARHTALPSEGRARRYLGGFRYWRSALAQERLDLFECFNLPIIKTSTGRTLLTIHDVRGLRTESGALERAVFKTVLLRSLKSADHVITVSESMRKEILSFYPDVPISVISNGLDSSEYELVSAADLQAFRLKFRLPADFVLAVGHFEKRKNYARLIDAIALLRDRGRPCNLLIVGNDSGARKAVEERVVSSSLTGSVNILSGISDFEIRCAYKLCRVFVFPSCYEGFGIPILEAMAARRPMVLSDIPVFREITQNNGVYFPPQDVELMAAAIEMMLTSSTERERLIDYGDERIKSFSYRGLAAQVESVYSALL